MKKLLFVTFFLFFLLTTLNSSQLILQQTDVIKNYKIEQEFFDYSLKNLYFSNFKKVIVIVEKNINFKTTLRGLFKNIPGDILSKAVVLTFKLSDDKIIAKKIIILDRKYEIVNINNKEFYKFTLYIKHKEKVKKGFLHNIIKFFKIAYGNKNY